MEEEPGGERERQHEKIVLHEAGDHEHKCGECNRDERALAREEEMQAREIDGMTQELRIVHADIVGAEQQQAREKQRGETRAPCARSRLECDQRRQERQDQKRR